jgi:hypothetical protein
MNYPALIFWLLIAWSVTASRGTLLVLLLASIPFASLALLPPAFLGMSILPQQMFAVVLILKVVTPELMPLSPKLLTALRLRHLGCLALFLLVGIVATVIAPRLFQGEVVIVPMREAFKTDLLSPILPNLTQSGYVALSVMTVFAVTLMVDDPGFVETLLAGLLAGGTVCAVTGLIDLAAASTGMESLLEPFRNADYAYLTEASVADVKRVVGFTPEASAYGPICVDFAAGIGLLRTLYAEGLQRILATMVAIGLVVMALLSTSSTAYVGVAVLGLVYAANLVRRGVLASALGQQGLVWEFLAGLSLIAALLFFLIARADLFDPILNVIEEVIFNKPLTGSFYERSHWNTVGWETVASTWGLGVGFGSTRTSSWLAAIVSNAGLVGAAFMGIFLVQTFARGSIWRTPLSVELLSVLKLSLFPALVMAAINAPGPDFGLWMAVVFGAIAGIAEFRPQRGSLDRAAADRPRPFHAGGRTTVRAPALGRTVPSVPERCRDTGAGKPPPRPSF